MTLQITGDRDQAVLALVVKEARVTADAQNHYVGRTAIQKIMYFLKIRGVALNYKFDIYHYGPYCQDVVTDIDWLIADHVIKDTSSKQGNYSNYAPDEAMDEIIRMHPGITNDEKTIIKETTQSLIPLDPKHLELLMTLDYLLRDEKATGRKTGLKSAVVDRFIEVKRNKFARPDVESMYDIVDQMSDTLGRQRSVQ